MRPLRVVVGLFFIGTGAFKLLDPAAFAELLAAAGIPFATLNAWLVCFAEIGCGAALIASAFITRPPVSAVSAGAAAILAVDMCVAIATVGIRTQRGDPVIVRGVPAAGEPWRLALEVVVLAVLVVIVVLSVRSRAPLAR
jgi:uncharacterized membrane protein YphA (DoxX/SURF4 family)